MKRKLGLALLFLGMALCVVGCLSPAIPWPDLLDCQDHPGCQPPPPPRPFL